MTTNREWLYSLEPDELTVWFDAQRVDANDTLSAENDVSAGAVDANDANAMQDSREKLEADVSNFGFIMNLEGYQLDMIHGWLNRQAAITERELCRQCDWPSLAAQPDYESQGRIVALTNKVDELTAERDALADDLLTCNKEREEYRELFSKSLTLAAEIVNLQP